MIPQELTEMTDEALLQEAKKMKSATTYDAVILGFLIGVATYSAVKNGFGLLTFVPLAYLPVAGRNKVRKQAIEKLLAERNLK